MDIYKDEILVEIILELSGWKIYSYFPSDNMCIICLDDCKYKNVYTTPCLHSFHKECIYGEILKSIPKCIGENCNKFLNIEHKLKACDVTLIEPKNDHDSYDLYANDSFIEIKKEIDKSDGYQFNEYFCYT